jgi:hypothetical protein
MSNKNFNEYAKWLFNIYDKFRESRGWDSVEKVMSDVEKEIKSGERNGVRGLKYQGQVLGFLTERLFTYYILSRFDHSRILTVPYKKFENISI